MYPPSSIPGYAFAGVHNATLAGALTLPTDADKSFYVLDADGSARVVTLPALSDARKPLFFRNAGSSGDLTLTEHADDGGSVVQSLDPGECCALFPDGTTAWRVVLLTEVELSALVLGSITGNDSSLGITGQAATADTGGAVAIAGGATTTSGAGGAVSLTGGAGSGTSNGGAASVVGGASGAGATGTGGAVAVTGGASLATNGAGGAASVTGGAGVGTGNGGAAGLVGGAAGATGTGGAVAVTGGAATAGVGGAATVTGGAGGGTGAGAVASVVGGASGAGATGNGGNAAVTGGAAASTNGGGGSVILTGGAKAGSGIDGAVITRSKQFRTQSAPGAGADQNETLTAAQMINGIFVHTIAQARTLTTPTGAQISAGCPAALAVGDSFDFSLITVGTGSDDIVTLTAGDGNVTFVGPVTVGPDIQATEGLNAYGTWRFRNTGTNTWVGYRIG